MGYTFTVDATISSGTPITQADFFLDDLLLASDTAEPFSAVYKVDNSVPAGPHVVRIRATNSSGITTNKEILVNLNPSL